MPALEAADAAKASGLQALDAARARLEADLARVAGALRYEGGEIAAVRSRVALLARLEPAHASTSRQAPPRVTF